jgi:hypothetical protein
MKLTSLARGSRALVRGLERADQRTADLGEVRGVVVRRVVRLHREEMGQNEKQTEAYTRDLRAEMAKNRLTGILVVLRGALRKECWVEEEVDWKEEERSENA